MGWFDYLNKAKKIVTTAQNTLTKEVAKNPAPVDSGGGHSSRKS